MFPRIAIPFVLTFVISYLAVFIILDYKNLYLPYILHLHHHVFAFTDGVRDVKMKEELTIHEDLCTTLEMFHMANKCARAEEGRLSLLELFDADPKDKNTKTKDVKRKGPAVIADEPETKSGCGHPESSKSNWP